MSLVVDPQRLAADPGLSAFVTANAGSGKTKTLIDRVARLLLRGAEPAAILCVTYTKAAAAEMQRRLYAQLGGWSVAEDEDLVAQLAALEGRAPGDYGREDLSAARALFARALETPGGLKIQTIHAFCEKLLRRFPIEAGVSPGFRVMDDSAAAAVARSARGMVARLALGGGPYAEPYARLATALDYASFQAMFAGFEDRRGALAAWFAREGGMEGAVASAWARLGFPDGAADPETVETEGAPDAELWLACAETLASGGKTDQQNAAAMRALALDPAPAFDAVLKALFTDGGEGTPATWPAKTAAFKAREGLREALLAEQDRLAAVRERRRAARIGRDTADALTLARAYLVAYGVEKAAAGALDFADLVDKTRALVAQAPMAAWVLYKLDGGIDHILLDEAQDTAPDQWAILQALTGEFFSGEGLPRHTRALSRSLFIVGDEKQSIYSFQGADPARLLSETDAYLARIAGAGRRGEPVPLIASWRSTVEVLSFVDAVFAREDTRAGVRPPRGEERVSHEPMRKDHRGCVDLWPLFQEAKGEERRAWDAPLDLETEASANRRLAEAIACEIEALVARGDAVWDAGARAWRPARFGDVLILVRRRRALFEDILRALKRRKVPVAGADRLALSQHIVFDDLLALARFALFPDDELTLAALLKSPFCGLEDDDLFALAHRRGQGLWPTLCARAGERPAWAAAQAFLSDILAEAPGRRPFEFFSRALGSGGGASMRARLLRRLGAEAEDALDEFLAQVLAAESRGVHDLESLAHDFASLDIMVKRELEAGRDEVRVMTAHGAKGLEAPIVFVPETTLESGARGSPLLETEDGGFLWCAAKSADCEASSAARELRVRKDAEEAQRLLYVALTRARDRLVLCGRLPANRKPETVKGWWSLIESAFAHDSVAPHKREVACGEVVATRFGPDPEALGSATRRDAERDAPPPWTRAPAGAEPAGRFAAPSNLEADPTPAASPLARDSGLGRFRRGDLIHRLLQVLPDIAPDAREAAARALMGREPDLDPGQRAEMVGAALAVLADARFGEVFGPGSVAEAALAGRIEGVDGELAVSGRVDRLVVLPDRVLVVDFKTNRPAPLTIAAVDPAYVRQLALYAAVLRGVFPDRPVEAALLWTDGPRLMAVPENLMALALAELGRSP